MNLSKEGSAEFTHFLATFSKVATILPVYVSHLTLLGSMQLSMSGV